MIALAVSYGVKMVLSNHVYRVGDTIFHQVAGGPIGLELTGAVSRPFMMFWDKMYLRNVRKAGMNMLLFKRFVDDSNQVAKAPPAGYEYDKESAKIVYDDSTIVLDETANTRLARILKEIANEVMEGILMEEDHPNKHEDNKMPILDMKVWMNGEKRILYQHYEKPIASRQILHSKSAQAANCKRNVHVQELIRRILNSSSRLDWQSQVAPVLTDYMGRMLLAGYSEGQRKSILQQALNIYDCMKKEDENGTRPLFRSKYWQFEERQKKKKKKKTNWSTRGGHIAPIFVPPTPNSELAKMLRKVAESEAEAGVMFKIVETGGNSVKSLIEKSNPTATRGYDETNCMACQDGRGKGGNCRLSNIQYEVECQLCP